MCSIRNVYNNAHSDKFHRSFYLIWVIVKGYAVKYCVSPDRNELSGY